MSKEKLDQAEGMVRDASSSSSPSSAQAMLKSISAPVAADIQIVVPKRLVRSAVKRNTVKRVLREAWRAACLAQTGLVWRFNLKAHPGGAVLAKSQHARAQLRKASARASGARPVEFPLAAAQGFARHKQQLRAEADALLADAGRKLTRQRSTSSGQSGRSARSGPHGRVQVSS
ncbi:MAG: ribonuclease P protein component [Lautropia sp.]|nr:ribonuclease P protein component [Lautropia sp.]